MAWQSHQCHREAPRSVQGGNGRGDREGLVLGSEGPSNTNRTFEGKHYKGFGIMKAYRNMGEFDTIFKLPPACRPEDARAGDVQGSAGSRQQRPCQRPGQAKQLQRAAVTNQF